MHTINTAERIVPHFQFEGTLCGIHEMTSGHINVTYRVEYADEAGHKKSYTLQRINTVAFRDPVSLMENIRLVTEHIRKKLEAEGEDPSRRVLQFVKADNGTLLYEDEEGGFWRAYGFVDHAVAYDKIKEDRDFYEAGRGFGLFQNALADFPAEKLSETIPNFHNTPKRYEAFKEALRRDAAGRASEVAGEVAFFAERESMMHLIVDGLASGALPYRVTHNDTKMNNVLLDEATGKAICVIDLDTVMPGSALYDYGDAIRYGACAASEEETDLGRVRVNMQLFEAFTRGFLEAVGDRLTPAEIELLPVGAKMMACELSMRFLTDYLDGDVYFKTAYPTHNLDRAHAQMQLLMDMERCEAEMTDVIRRIVG